MDSTRLLKLLLSVVILLGIGLLLFGGYYFYKSSPVHGGFESTLLALVRPEPEPLPAQPHESVGPNGYGQLNYIGSFLAIDGSNIWVSVNGLAYKVTVDDKTMFAQQPANLVEISRTDPNWAKKITPAKKADFIKGNRVIVEVPVGNDSTIKPATYVMKVL